MMESLFTRQRQPDNRMYTLEDTNFKILFGLFRFHVIMISDKPTLPIHDYPKCFKYLFSHLKGDKK